MAINFDQSIISNLTNSQMQSGVTLSPEKISEWCLSQHFTHNYEGMYLIIVAIISIYVYQTLQRFDISIPEIKTKKGTMILSKQILIDDLFWLIKYSLILFCFIWLYNSKDWHWLDWLFNLYS